MNRRASDIFSQFEHIHERMDQAYRRLTGSPGSPGFSQPFIEPPVDVYETVDEVVVLIEMAAIVPDEVELEVEGRALVLRGERKPLRGRPGRVYSQMEIGDGCFRRELVLPAEVDAGSASAVYQDGILELSLPKSSPSPSRQLRIVVHRHADG